MTATPNSTTGRAAAKARAVLGALSLLVLGGVLGIAIDRHFPSGDRHFPSGDRHSPAAAFHDIAMSSLGDRLDLDADQRRQIDSILAARQHTLRQTWQMLHAHLGAAVDTVHRDIEAVLTPEQRAAFREWLHDVNAER
jgi:Spy/CpxP family protein refolding chaperone